ncbi:MAG: hypothetical protein ACREPA_10695, partial [Candidatus Dormibacteraceae bacterium]
MAREAAGIDEGRRGPAPAPGGGDGDIMRIVALTKRFGGLTAVDDVSFEVRRGEIFALIGP